MKSKKNDEYDTLLHEIVAELQLCHCGLPEVSIVFIYKFLLCIDNLPKSSWQEFEDITDKLIRDNIEEVKYTLYYFFNTRGFLEHGSRVPGWILDRDLLDKLNKFTRLFLEKYPEECDNTKS